jgi:hypothetical protein
MKSTSWFSTSSHKDTNIEAHHPCCARGTPPVCKFPFSRVPTQLLNDSGILGYWKRAFTTRKYEESGYTLTKLSNADFEKLQYVENGNRFSNSKIFGISYLIRTVPPISEKSLRRMEGGGMLSTSCLGWSCQSMIALFVRRGKIKRRRDCTERPSLLLDTRCGTGNRGVWISHLAWRI